MVSVTFSSDDGRYKLRLDGHAGYNPGNDIVCAAVSSIIFALEGWLANSREHIAQIFTMRCRPGDVEIDVSGDDTLRPAFEMAYIGLAQIAETYPDNVIID
jgi:uncharacterized protein YsxB (DUF464 family)